MNSFTVFAQIVKVSDTHYKKLNMTPMVTMVIRFPNPRKDRPPVDLSVIAYGELARQVRKECRIGDCLIFEAD